MQEKLKKCPHCGAEVKLVTIADSWSEQGKHMIRCCSNMEHTFIMKDLDNAEKEILNTWNKTWNDRE